MWTLDFTCIPTKKTLSCKEQSTYLMDIHVYWLEKLFLLKIAEHLINGCLWEVWFLYGSVTTFDMQNYAAYIDVYILITNFISE